MDSCSKFWFQPLSEKETVESYDKILNEPDCSIIEPYSVDEPIDKKTIIVARNKTNGRLCRARILASTKCSSRLTYKIIFIDIGQTQDCSVDDLFNFNVKVSASQLPPRCFECCLAEIQPSTVNVNGGNLWDFASIDLFKRFDQGKRVVAKVFLKLKFIFVYFILILFAQVYSVVNGVANVFVIRNGLNFNDVLIEKKYGEYCEESFISKVKSCYSFRACYLCSAFVEIFAGQSLETQIRSDAM